MRLRDIRLRDHDSDWELATTEFFPDLTLLVGGSGVGKTRILRAISTLQEVAQGAEDDYFWGIEWCANFSTNDGSEWCWKGAFEPRTAQDGIAEEDDFVLDYWAGDQSETVKARVRSEFLSRDGLPLIERNEQGIRLRGELTPKLSPYESVLKILSEDDDVSVAHRAFGQMLWVDHSEEHPERSSWPYAPSFDGLCNRFDSIEKIRSSTLPTRVKLAVAYERERPVFDEIVAQFKCVFPQVEEVEMRRIRAGLHDWVRLRVKERGVGKWIPEHRISSGMTRTLLHLSRMVLWPDGTLILIDEFENSLGVNCIDFVTDDLIQESNRLQFIITSHHPYIINNIDTQHWKIVMRDGSRVTTRNATEFGLERSSHEAFAKLLNLREYQEGIAVP